MLCFINTFSLPLKKCHNRKYNYSVFFSKGFPLSASHSSLWCNSLKAWSIPVQNIRTAPKESSQVLEAERARLWGADSRGRHPSGSQWSLVVHISWKWSMLVSLKRGWCDRLPNNSPNWESMSTPAGPPSSIRKAVVRAPVAKSSIPDLKSCIGLASNCVGWFWNRLSCNWPGNRFSLCWKPIWGLAATRRSEGKASRRTWRGCAEAPCLNNILLCDWTGGSAGD